MGSKTHINDILIKLLLKGCGQNDGVRGKPGSAQLPGRNVYVFLQTTNVFKVSLATYRIEMSLKCVKSQKCVTSGGGGVGGRSGDDNAAKPATAVQVCVSTSVNLMSVSAFT